MISLYARLAAIAALLVALAGGGWWCYSQGKKTVMAEWTAERLATSENARLREQAAQRTNERIDREQQTFKKRDADIASGTADSVRKYTAADDGANTDTECRADDPRPTIARECTAALKLLDDYARGLARQSAGLQDFASNVCVKQALAQ